jgi:nucleoside-triphosphatase
MGDNILLVGRPGVGKTTVIMRVIGALADVVSSNGTSHMPGRGIASGFYTQELRSGGQRQGFRAMTLDAKQVTLAHVDSHSPLRVSSYGVELEAFEREIIPAIDPALTDAPLLVIDEIGLMECYSAPFRETVLRALNADRVVLGTIALRGNGFVARIKGREDVELVEVTVRNRDGLVGELAERVRELLPGRR